MGQKFYIAISVWFAIVVISLLWNVYATKEEAKDLVKLHAEALFSKDKATRLWAASHGGVYVPKSERTPPNPFLEHVKERDIVTPSGKELTLMNPAYMLRQMMKDYENVYGIKGHITSDIHFREETKPDNWELKALAEFKKGVTEFLEFSEINGKLHLRFMKPLFADETCLKCHANQGYKVGDLRGGVSLSIPMDEYLKTAQKSFWLVTLSHFIFLIVGLIGIYIIFKQVNKFLATKHKYELSLVEEREYLKHILDSQKHIVVINNGEDILDTNETFFKFFTQYKNLEEFHKEHKCVCEFFENNINGYIQKDMNGISWIDYLSANQNRNHKVLIKKDGKDYIFSIYLKHLLFEYGVRNIVVLYDITELELYQNHLEELVQIEVKKRREKEYLLVQQSKDLALNDLLINISHHWRQPLAGVLAMIDDIEEAYKYNELDAKYIAEFKESSRKLLINLSDTITNFYSIYKVDEVKEPFSIKEAFDIACSFVVEYFKSLNIKVSKEIDETLIINGNKKEFIQVILNILNNSKDIFIIRNIKTPIMKISVFKDINDIVVIEIWDNGGGLDENIKDKIFEPYFTTKHKTSGTGLGLFIVKSVIENRFFGSVSFENVENGAKFILRI